MQIRDASESDLPAVVALYNFYVTTSPATFDVAPVSVGDRREWFAEHSVGGRYRLLVAEETAGEVVGWATTSPFRPRPAYVTTVEASVYVRPEAVGRGVGTRLYGALFRALEGEDVERVVAGVVVPNPPSVSLHRRFGFRHVGTFTRVGRKFGRYWDVAWFERPHGARGAADGQGPPGRTGEFGNPDPPPECPGGS